MRYLVIVAMLSGSAAAEPVARIGGLGGYDASAPDHREDGFVGGVGYRLRGITAALEASYLQYDTSDQVDGGAKRAGVLLQQNLVSARCHRGEDHCPHLDLDLGAGYRWVRWEPHHDPRNVLIEPAIDSSGRELTVGVSATFGLRFALHYVWFAPDVAPASTATCRGVCSGATMPPAIPGGSAVMLEAGYAIGGS